PDGTTVAAAGWDGKVQFWDVAAQKPGRPTLDCGGRVAAVAFFPGRDTNVLACAVWNENWVAPGGPSGKIILHDLTRNESRTLPRIPGKFDLPLGLLPGGVTSLAISPDGKLLALGVGQFYPDLKRTTGHVVLVDVASLEARRTIAVPDHLVLSL